jgi:hypothetical protein
LKDGSRSFWAVSRNKPDDAAEVLDGLGRQFRGESFSDHEFHGPTRIDPDPCSSVPIRGQKI